MRPSFLAAAVVAVGLSGCGGGEETLQGLVQDPRLSVGDVSFPTAGGGEQPMVADDGELLVVYWGFTSCPDVCPTTLSRLADVVDELEPADAERVQVGMVTVDPERDTPEQLAAYVRGFVDDALALRQDDPAALARAAERFGVTFEVQDHDPGDTDYDVGHTSLLFVIDDTGTVLVQWPSDFERERMLSDLRLLVNEA